MCLASNSDLGEHPRSQDFKGLMHKHMRAGTRTSTKQYQTSRPCMCSLFPFQSNGTFQTFAGSAYLRRSKLCFCESNLFLLLAPLSFCNTEGSFRVFTEDRNNFPCLPACLMSSSQHPHQKYLCAHTSPDSKL